MSQKLWGGRFSGGVDARIDAFTSALSFDRRLVSHDLEGSMAHARMLLEQEVLTGSDGQAILAGLASLLADIEAGVLQVEGPDEDVHSWIERNLTDRIGEPALRLHTARSRNDQTATALRLYVRTSLVDLARRTGLLLELWLDLAAEHRETWLPGYTHLQRGQPVSLAHHLLAHFWSFEADARRLRTLHDGGFRSPLGAGALAGSPYPIAPKRSAELLGFVDSYPNSMLAVSDRDYVAEAIFVSSLAMVHLSRFATEVILWTTPEFGFATLDDSIAKGSSLMPQKKNPEAAEILRGKTGRVIGDLAGLLSVLQGLPLTYNSDLQEDKEGLFDALDTAAASLECAAAIAGGLNFCPDRMAAALVGGFLTATDLADYLVAKGVAFRSAHHLAGQAVRSAEEKGGELWELELAELQEVSSQIEADVFEILRPESSAGRKRHRGGPAPESVGDQLEEAAGALGELGDWLDGIEASPIRRAYDEGRLAGDAL
ncbi:MAG: argininosuccinate lyase [Acidobacteriota bacterium]|nr:argininosuccinate lyase [Acidobacteriota bacterium]